IEVALAPGREDQKFKSKISFYFTLMIGILLVGFFSIIAFKSDKNIERAFLGDSGLMFVTMFVLIIAVILFGILGILGILEVKELTAILSGVSGYILARGAKPAPLEEQNISVVAGGNVDDSSAGSADEYFDGSAPAG
ncbi:MAG: hypothetical protein HRT57_07800, partial [Crocinitomicaceae bacterium]|nr:hypothetical protein [Crocinitomicaceae bacterium]